MIVQKYGGTSVGTSERLISVAQIIEKACEKEPVLAVVSAMSSYVKSEGTTSRLLHAADCAIHQEDFKPILLQLRDFHINTVKECIKDSNVHKSVQSYVERIFDKLKQFLEALTVIREFSSRSSDRILRVGEKLSASILAGVLKDRGLKGEYIDLSNIAPEGYSKVSPKFFTALESNLLDLLSPVVKEKKVPVITGFLGEIPGGIIESIGRGYTDYTSSLVAAVLKVRELQIWKEVDGIFTADPKLVDQAKVLASITPQEAAELTYFGSEVIHPFTMERVTRANVPVRIKNTFRPNEPGTLITEQEIDRHVIKNITAKKNITILNIGSNRMLMAYGFMAKVFRVFEKYGVIIDLIATSEINISLTVEKSDRLGELIEELEGLGDVTIYKDRAIISMVGQKMRLTTGISGKMFSCLSEEGINIEMISQGASEINISCVVENKDADKAVQALHKRFINSDGLN